MKDTDDACYYNEHWSNQQDWQDTVASYNRDFEDEVRGWPRCPACGAVNHPDTSHCEACGEYMTFPLPSGTLACPVCGEALKPPKPHSCGNVTGRVAIIAMEVSA